MRQAGIATLAWRECLLKFDVVVFDHLAPKSGLLGHPLVDLRWRVWHRFGSELLKALSNGR